jgi:hypothetical protein
MFLSVHISIYQGLNIHMNQYKFHMRRHLEIDIHEGVFIDGEHQDNDEIYVPVMEEDNFVYKKIKHLKDNDWII